MSAPWTEAHQREALRRTYEIAATLDYTPAAWLAEGAGGYVQSEDLFRMNLEDTQGCAFHAARIEREVRRVRAIAEASPELAALIAAVRIRQEAQLAGLAEGRLVLENDRRFVVRQPGQLDEDFATPGGAKLAASQRRGALAATMRVTRWRRVQP